MKLSILKKMWLAFATVISLVVIVGSVGIWSLTDMTRQYKAIIDEDMHRVELAKSIQNVQKETGTLLLEYIMFAKEEAITNLSAKIEERNHLMAQLKERSTDDKSIQLIDHLEQQTLLLFESNDNVIKLKREGKDFRAFSSNSAQINAVVLADLEALIIEQEKQSAATREALEQEQASMIRLLVAAMVFSIVIGTLVAFKIGRHIAAPVQKVTAGLEQIASGNLTVQPLLIKNKDEIGTMGHMYNQMLRDLQVIVGNVRDSSAQLAASAEQLSASSQESLHSSHQVANLTEQQMKLSTDQGSYVHSSVDAMQELGMSVHSIADDNSVMLQATQGVHTQIEKGAAVVTDVSTQMQEIHTTFVETTEIMHDMANHSDNIQKVTALITGIAEQTNLLALNAAIEAARAGDAGKGFAVVADEVRKLAEQSRNSAEEIANIVNLIQLASNNALQAITVGGEKVETGMLKTTQSITVFNEIEHSIEDVVTKVQSVAAAIEQVQNMTQTVVGHTEQIQTLATTVVENAHEVTASTEEQLASTEDISSNAQSLAELAENLQKQVNHFKM